jgi:hypothetical protein
MRHGSGIHVSVYSAFPHGFLCAEILFERPALSESDTLPAERFC